MARLAGYGGSFYVSDLAQSDNTAKGGFTSWSLDISADMLDFTDFASGGDREFQRGLKTWTVTAERFWISSLELTQIAGNEVYVKMWYDGTNNLRGKGKISGVSPNTPVDALVNETLTIQGTSDLFKSDA